MLKLEVPHHKQLWDGWCLPASVEMILDYLQGQYGDDIKVLTQTEIAKICSTKTDGTDFDRWEILSKKTMKFTPSIEFAIRCNQNPKGLLVELSKGQPVIVFLEGGNGSEAPAHAVVITGIDKATSTIYYNDPYGEKDEAFEIGRFEKEWQKDFCGWFLEIGLQDKLEK